MGNDLKIDLIKVLKAKSFPSYTLPDNSESVITTDLEINQSEELLALHSEESELRKLITDIWGKRTLQMT